MKIAIIGAMEVEIEIFRGLIENIQTHEILGQTFYIGTLHGKDVVLTQCGIGKANAAMGALAMVSLFEATHVINSGVAGAIASELIPGDVVASTDLVYHDVDVTGFGYPVGQVPGTASPFFTADETMLSLAKSQDIYTGRIATGDQFISDPTKKDWIKTTFAPMCVEMEGAAIAQVCTVAKVPFLVIRAISDTADGNAEEEYAGNLDKGVQRATTITEHIIKSL